MEFYAVSFKAKPNDLPTFQILINFVYLRWQYVEIGVNFVVKSMPRRHNRVSLDGNLIKITTSKKLPIFKIEKKQSE